MLSFPIPALGTGLKVRHLVLQYCVRTYVRMYVYMYVGMYVCTTTIELLISY